MTNTLRKIGLGSLWTGIGILGALTLASLYISVKRGDWIMPSALETIQPQVQAIDTSYAGIDTTALKERLHRDYILNDVYLPGMMNAAAENNPNSPASVVLKPYFDVGSDLGKRITARTDSLLKARGVQR